MLRLEHRHVVVYIAIIRDSDRRTEIRPYECPRRDGNPEVAARDDVDAIGVVGLHDRPEEAKNAEGAGEVPVDGDECDEVAEASDDELVEVHPGEDGMHGFECPAVARKGWHEYHDTHIGKMFVSRREGEAAHTIQSPQAHEGTTCPCYRTSQSCRSGRA
jgi:hypothetical protein